MNLMARSLYAHKPIDIKYFRIVPDTEDDRPRPSYVTAAFTASRASGPDLTL